MTLTETDAQVLIVGAGPSGLMMAAQLLRNGVIPIIIDSKQGPTDQSKALAVQARSLEIYRQMGLIDRILEGGKHAEGISLNEDGKTVASLSFNNVGEGQTAFPFVHLYQQSKNERLLLDFLTLNCCPVYWQTTLTSIKKNGQKTYAKLQTAKSSNVTITCDWIIGADGAHSIVRKQLNIPFSGDTYPHEFYLADVELNNPELGDKTVQLFMAKSGFAGFFPLPEPNRYRIIGKIPDGMEKNENLTIDDVLPALNIITNRNINIIQNHWFTIYRLHHRMADKFAEQRCFLIGDAAHIHSPVGGQGMNTGLQDAYNLAWKLAGVVNKQFGEKILDTYPTERMPVAKELLNTTDRVFNLILSRNWITGLFKKWALPGLLKWVWSKENLRELFFKRLSQINISYRDSAISLHLSQATQIKAGDRLPYLKVFDEKKQTETDLHEWCSKPGFVLIVFGKVDEADLFALARWITLNYPAMLNFFYLPPSAKNQHIFDAFEIKEGQGKSVIIRPDMHIGFINDKVDMGVMDNYLRNIVSLI